MGGMTSAASGPVLLPSFKMLTIKRLPGKGPKPSEVGQKQLKGVGKQVSSGSSGEEEDALPGSREQDQSHQVAKGPRAFPKSSKDLGSVFPGCQAFTFRGSEARPFWIPRTMLKRTNLLRLVLY